MRTSNIDVMHVFWNNAPHLNAPICKRMLNLFPKSKVCVWNIFPIPKRSEEYKVNEKLMHEWVSSISKGVYCGVLRRSVVVASFWLLRKIFNRFACVGQYALQILRLLPDVNCLAMVRLLRGPKNILMHGRLFSFGTMAILWLFGKRVIYIHWGGPMKFEGRVMRLFYRWTHKMCARVYVLMKPEEEMFMYVTDGAVRTLPYANDGLENVEYNQDFSAKNRLSRTIVVGNNAYYSGGYRAILERLNMDEWDQVICMFNYGKGHCDVSGLIKEFKLKYGPKFYSWDTTVPMDEYRSVMANAAFYFCPAATHSGLGAISNAICQGKAIFLRGQNYEWMRECGITVFNIDELPDYSYEYLSSLVPNVDVAENNFSIFKKKFGSVEAVNNWAVTIESAFGVK